MLLVIGPLDELGLEGSYGPCINFLGSHHGELKRINKLRVFDPSSLLVVRVGNLNELTTS